MLVVRVLLLLLLMTVLLRLCLLHRECIRILVQSRGKPQAILRIVVRLH